MAHGSATSSPVVSRGYWRAVPRCELFTGLVALGILNGLTGQAITAIQDGGFISAVLTTFGVSVIVWCAAVIAISAFARLPAEPTHRIDFLVAAVAVACFLAPAAKLSWVGLTGIAIYVLCTSPPRSNFRRGGWVLLALTIAMCWAGVGLTVFPSILDAEAMLASWLTGTTRVGNVIHFADGWGYLVVERNCSALQNIALAVLCWVLFARSADRLWTLRGAGWCLLACAATIVINTLRLGLLALQGEEFDRLHDTAATVTGWSTLAAIVVICWLGARHERIARP